MKGFTRDNKFIPMTDYKKVTRKSRDTKEKTQGVVIRKSRVPQEFKNPHPEFKEWFTAGARYNLLSDNEREFLLTEIGLPMPNFEPFTIQDIKALKTAPYSFLTGEIRARIQARVGGLQDADVGAIGFFPPILRDHLGIRSPIERLKQGDSSNLIGDIEHIDRLIKERIDWKFRLAEEPQTTRNLLMAWESLGIPPTVMTENLMRKLDAEGASKISIALGVIYDRQIHQPETVAHNGFDV